MEPPRQARKVVTALFCDVTGSTALGEELDPEVLRGVLNRYFAEIRAIIERHGGTVEKFIGDAVMAVFGIPRVREDDALRAVRAAADIRERLPAVAEDVGVTLRFRTGINTGPVLVGEGENLAVGDAVNVAARLEQAAQPGEIIVGEQTLGLVRDAVQVEAIEPLELKGKSERVAAYRLIAVHPVAAGYARHLDVLLVGRERELRLLGEAWDRAVDERACHLFTLLGAAGVGKSRLIAELLAGIGERATVLRGRCLHYGDGITFWPLVEALTAVGDPAADTLEHLSSGGTGTPEELFWEVRRLLESLAEECPVILYIDDLQWAEPMLLDLIDHVVDLSRGVPILMLCTARPELLEDRPTWGGGKLNATTLLLEPLGTQDAEALLERLADGLDREARGRVIAASEGNPLFLEEMVALARERGTVTVPPTIQALLAARLERLAVEERELLERGAVEGEVFHRLAVKALAGERLATEVGLRLAGLVRKELIRPHPPTLAGDEAFRFRHLLIRDAAYEGLPKAGRAELHERFARWLEHHGAELLELDEIAGWHLEQTVRYRRELGQEVDPAIAADAAAHLHGAGLRAGGRGDVAAATKLLGRALELVPRQGRAAAQISLDLAEQLFDESRELTRIEELLASAESDPATARAAQLTRLDLVFLTQPEGVSDAIEQSLPGLLKDLEEAGDERGLAKAHLLACGRHWLASRAGPAAEEALLAAQHAKRAGDEVLRSRATILYLGTLYLGPRHVRSWSSEPDAIELDEPSPLIRAGLMIVRADAAALEGEFDEARRLMAQGIELANSLGHYMAVGAHEKLAYLEIAAGNLEAALASLQQLDAGHAESGDVAHRSTSQADLADVYERLGDRGAAIAAIELSDQLSAREDVINYAITHRVRARLALADGNGEEAERWARSAVEHAFMTDFVTMQAAAKLDLARVLMGVGRREDAASEARAALELSESKGDRPAMARARALLEGL
ncbi:MAG TPA: adenylate/guanylate cyclase domain-containing protein [Solirubrobacteraceae bacterium]|nr:adenylate/guanylate cyclase domain-containing protein [Solirubrobacteraceae bacterium]